MKRFIQSLLLVAFFIGITVPAWAQSSTEGKEFWVGLTMAIKPPDGKTKDREAVPYIAISTKEVTIVTFASPAFPGETFSKTIGAFQWEKIDIPQKWWYPSGVETPSNVKSHADEVNKYGVYIKADHNISVFSILRAAAGMDASNILPTTALGTEYILQDYVPHAKNEGADRDAPYTTMATILATEDNTVVTVKPKGTLLKASTPKLVNNQITLNKGETYYMMAENSGSDDNCLSGTEVTANKNIAVFQGVPCTFIPHDIGNRDALYEQAMPVMYWGTEFIATRSYAKGANFIRITASESGQKTTIFVNGKAVSKQLNRGETYEIELASNTLENMNKNGDHKQKNDTTIIGTYIHIKTSCPSAVYSYDCGAQYYDKVKPEPFKNSSHTGDASSVWIAPMEQSIDQITFGACGTNPLGDDKNQTVFHYMDIVVETSSINQTTLYSYNKSEIMNISNEFEKVEGTIYSYARVYLDSADHTVNSSFTVANPKGLVAHVYGIGKSESYAYSVGSSAVVQGVKLDGKKYNDGSHITDKTFCINNPIVFDAKVGNDVIERVTWNMGDGTTAETEDSKITYLYNTPGWYDLTVNLWGHQVCDETSGTVNLGRASVSFRVVEADTIPVGSGHDCIEADSTYKGVKLTADSIQYLLTHNANTTNEDERKNCYDPVEITFMSYGIKTTHRDTVNAKDSALVGGVWYYPETVPADSIVTDTLYDSNQYDCDSIIYHYLNITTCLEIEIAYNADAHVCEEKKMDVSYEITKGKAGGAAVAFDGQSPVAITLDQVTKGKSVVVLPTENLAPGKHRAVILIEDVNCKDTLSKAYDFTVYYPDSIFAQKFNNVLAVYKKGYGKNKGYDFTAYQWYYNDEAIPNATESIYHVDGKLASGTYYVVLTRADMEPLQSCPITVNADELPSYDKNSAPARKMIQNSRMVIVKDGRTYDIYGQRVE